MNFVAICTEWDLVGFGQCKGSDGKTPAYDWLDGIGSDGAWENCRDAASADVDVVAWECDGGYPDTCNCQLFTETVTQTTDESNFVCYNRAGKSVRIRYGACRMYC